MGKNKTEPIKNPKGSLKIPEGSVIYDKLVPILLVGLGVIMVLLTLIAAGVLLGLF